MQARISSGGVGINAREGEEMRVCRHLSRSCSRTNVYRPCCVRVDGAVSLDFNNGGVERQAARGQEISERM